MNLGNKNELDGEDMKIKVDVITLHAVQNYGSVLQALATQKLLEKHGCEVRIINYIRENVKYENLLETRSNGNFLKKIILYPNIKRWKKVFEGFCNEYLNLTEKAIRQIKILKNIRWRQIFFVQAVIRYGTLNGIWELFYHCI